MVPIRRLVFSRPPVHLELNFQTLLGGHLRLVNRRQILNSPEGAWGCARVKGLVASHQLFFYSTSCRLNRNFWLGFFGSVCVSAIDEIKLLIETFHVEAFLGDRPAGFEITPIVDRLFWVFRVTDLFPIKIVFEIYWSCFHRAIPDARRYTDWFIL